MPQSKHLPKNIVRIDITGSGNEIGKSRIAAIIAAALRDAVSPEVNIEVHCGAEDFKVAASRALSLGIGRGQVDADAIFIIDNDDSFTHPEPPALASARFDF